MHEVNNPLEAITNLVYLTEKEEISNAAKDYLKEINEQLSLLTAVTRTSLSFYRDQSQAKDTNLVAVAKSALRLHFLRLAKGNVRVCQRFFESAISSVVASEILQVFSNLILNSMDSLPAGLMDILHIRVKRCHDAIHVTVADNGSGIPEHLEKRLFQPRVIGKQTGAGLGLWLSARIVEKHRGTIRCRTSRRTGKSGTIFRISLPHPQFGSQG